MSETLVMKSIAPFSMFDLPETPIEPKTLVWTNWQVGESTQKPRWFLEKEKGAAMRPFFFKAALLASLDILQE